MTPLLAELEDAGGMNPYFFGQDDTSLVFRAQGRPSQDIGMIIIGSDAEPEPTWLLDGSYNERNAELSPDGRWMAYESDESGRYEIYVRPFPNVDDDRVQVSNNGGRQPLWSRDGTELFYLEGPPMRLMNVSVEATDTRFAFSGRTEVLEWPYFSNNSPAGRTYDISADGTRFLALTDSETDTSTTDIVVIENWTQLLERTLPGE